MTVAIKVHHFVTECMSFYSQEETNNVKEMASCHSKPKRDKGKHIQ